MTPTDGPYPGDCDVAIVGGGPAGLALATTLKRLGIARVQVLERDSQAGGVPRHCGHYPFGLREYRRLMTGPDYARRTVAEAVRAGVTLCTGATVAALGQAGKLSVSTHKGPAEIQARRVVLCTGVREATRAQRMISGDRVPGVMSTGALQSLVYQQHLRPFDRPVILGTELVSFSAIATCRHLGMQPAAMIEGNSRITARRAFQPYAALRSVPLVLGARDLRIVGTDRVQAVTYTDHTGKEQRIETDGVIVSGDFRPDAALLRLSHLEVDPGTGGPVINQFGQCTDPAYYSAGNLLRPAETAGWCWREGVATAHRIADDLAHNGRPAPQHVAICPDDPALAFVVPQRLSLTDRPNPMTQMQIGLSRPVDGQMQARTGEHTFWHARLKGRPVRRILMPLQPILQSNPGAAVYLSTNEDS